MEKFSVGITGLPFTPVQRLSNIIGFHYSAIGQSHMASIIDVVLGSLRYSINGHTRNDPTALAAAARILPILSPLFFRENGRTDVSELGIFFSPKTIRAERYQTIYNNLKNFLSANGIS